MAEAGEDFFFDEDSFEEVEVLRQDMFGFVEDDEEEAGFVDEGIGFHFAEVVDGVVAPLGAVTGVADVAFAELVGDFDFEPEGFGRGSEVGGVEERGCLGIEFELAALGGEDDVATGAMGEFFSDRGGVMDFFCDFIMVRETVGEECVKLKFFAGVEAIDGLFETEVGFGLVDDLAEVIGERRKVPLEGKRHEGSLARGKKSEIRSTEARGRGKRQEGERVWARCMALRHFVRISGLVLRVSREAGLARGLQR